MRTLQDLKRKLERGQKLKMVYTCWGNTAKLNKIRYVIKTQGNGVYLGDEADQEDEEYLNNFLTELQKVKN